VGINKRVSLRKFTDDIRRWVEEDRSDEWIASALGTSPSSVQSFRSRTAIYRRHATTSTLYDPRDFSSYEGVLEPEGPGIWFDPEIGSDPRWHKRWKSTERIELRLTPTRIVFLRRGAPEARGRPVSERFGTPRPVACACRHGIWRLVSICSLNVPDPATPVASLRRARSRRAHNASVGIIS
jgi:hypothetical protein